MSFHVFGHGDNFFDDLAGEVLEVAGFENRDDTLLDFLAEQPLLVRRILLSAQQRRRRPLNCGYDSFPSVNVVTRSSRT